MITVVLVVLAFLAGCECDARVLERRARRRLS